MIFLSDLSYSTGGLGQPRALQRMLLQKTLLASADALQRWPTLHKKRAANSKGQPPETLSRYPKGLGAGVGDEMKEHKAKYPEIRSKMKLNFIGREQQRCAKLNGLYTYHAFPPTRFCLYVSYSLPPDSNCSHWVPLILAALSTSCHLCSKPFDLDALFSAANGNMESISFAVVVATMIQLATNGAIHGLEPRQHWREGKYIRGELRILAGLLDFVLLSQQLMRYDIRVHYPLCHVSIMAT